MAAQIIKTVEQRIAPLDDPRTLGSAQAGNQAGYWRWRIGDCRVVARAEEERITALMVWVAHRREDCR
ncbi:MAG: hypothetical protein BVN33_13080 [Proteobacteria bacterium ST_bin13]|nr:MAG: hypothetical protein BVN33_13080 [Proteobacteria bacterium ST_bin13]